MDRLKPHAPQDADPRLTTDLRTEIPIQHPGAVLYQIYGIAKQPQYLNIVIQNMARFRSFIVGDFVGPQNDIPADGRLDILQTVAVRLFIRNQKMGHKWPVQKIQPILNPLCPIVG